MCCMFSSIANFGGGGTKDSSGILSGFRSGEPSSIGQILGEGIRGSIDCVARKASTVSLVFAFAKSLLLYTTSSKEDDQEAADQILFSSSERVFDGYFFGASFPITIFEMYKSSSSLGVHVRTNCTESLSDSSSSRSLNSEAGFREMGGSFLLGTSPPLALDASAVEASMAECSNSKIHSNTFWKLVFICRVRVS